MSLTIDKMPDEEIRHEIANDLFCDLQNALKNAPDYAKIYHQYSQILRKCLDDRTRSTQLNLCGAFAKMDYLLKEGQANAELAKASNSTRARLRRRYTLTADEQRRHHLHDLRNICRFIAFAYGTAVPEALEAQFPDGEEKETTGTLIAEYERVIVERWDKKYLYVRMESRPDGRTVKVCHAEGNKAYPYDWGYLNGLLAEGSQLNLVRPRMADGVVYPELIIYEPDYLVNISTVARCFTNYADSHRVELIKKLEPNPNSEALMLGNLAGQLLDESIHQGSRSYMQSVKDFFKDSATNLLTIELSKDFHDNARRQQVNINHALHETLPASLKRFDSKEGMVEPSFFSEMLGMQGRMDYLQMDFKVLLEQKSGKGGFPYDGFVHPTHTPEHYVQLLLYMALIRYNYREIYERNNRELHAFLLYSKYSESLLGLGFAPELIFQAIKVRNCIAWQELQLAKPDGYRILEELTPDQLNEKHVNNKLWTDYQRPSIEYALNTLHNASPLEKDYFFRYMTFLSNEHMLSKMGDTGRKDVGFAATWHDSAEEKMQRGDIYYGLTMLAPTIDTEGAIDTVELELPETVDNDISNFRVGDIVVLYPHQRGEEPDARKTMVFRCTIKALSVGSITLTLKSRQSDNRVFAKQEGMVWAIEHDFMEASYGSQYRAMFAFLSAPKSRRDLILLQREPETDATRMLKGDYGDFNDLVMRIKRARDFFLLMGPPGTGKTSYGMLYAVQEELLEEGSSVLLTSYTNRAVDEICGKLHEAGIDFLRIGNAITCDERYRDRLLSSKVQEVGTLEALREKLLTARVVVGTTSSLCSSINLLQMMHFTLAVVDEAAQILEPQLIGLLGAHKNGVPAIEKFVMIGDHKQLPAVVQQDARVSKVREPRLNEIQLTDCRLSLFERLHKRYHERNDVSYMLTRQGRMHHEIAMFPNITFYGGRLTEVPLPRQTMPLPPPNANENAIKTLLESQRLAFIASNPTEEALSDKVNQNEADIIAAIVEKIYEIEKGQGFDINRTVGVIVPYRNQISAIRKTIDRHGFSMLHDVCIDTVERYQGSQRRYIVYGFTAQRMEQLRFLTESVFIDTDGSKVDRKLNVAMTRAEEHLIMVGNVQLLSRDETFGSLIEHVKKHGCYIEVPKDDFVAGRFEVN